MRLLITISRIVVGLLFIFSGLVKANDPLGLSYKMQEFFEIWGMSRFDSWTLLSSVLMNAFEIIAGFALLLGWRIKLFSWLLLVLILFFTFLTGYTFITGKPTNCGCFGDCLPITSKTSFLKDVVLTLLIGFLFWKQKFIKPIFGKNKTTAAMLLVTLFSIGFQWYTLTYMPVVDCLPFRKGKNIPQQMKPAPGSVPDSFAIRFVYEKGGKQFEFSPAELPDDLATYNYLSRTDKLVRKGNADPPIKGFALVTDNNEDVTEAVLTKPGHALLLFSLGFEMGDAAWIDDIRHISIEALHRNIPLYIVTSNYQNALDWMKRHDIKSVSVFKCDNTAIRTAARTNPSLYLLEQGTVIDKRSSKNFDNILEEITALPIEAVSLPVPAVNDSIQP